tara:strand:+ start:22017 stop:23597 length:1581 start_codon:yes stop_codon:yes gene_type:complete
MHKTTVIQRALISVTDKTGIVALGQALHKKGIEILSTGGTAQELRNHQIPVIDISQYTQFPEMMDGRLKTLHPKIYGGILGRRDTDINVMAQHDIQDIDLVVVNLYRFQEAISQDNVVLSDAIEKIDIGGPALIRAAAKNFSWCTVVTDVNDYAAIIEELQTHNGIQEMTRFMLAKKAFQHTAQYDGQISNYLSKLDHPDNSAAYFGQTLNSQYTLKQVLRYGENPHQQAAFYQNQTTSNLSCFAQTKQLQGKALSYNNILDGEAALKCIRRFEHPSCVIVKHTNPCGVAQAEDLSRAYTKAYQCDPQSAFGGIIAFNRTVDAPLMETILSQQFVEVMIAPEFEPAALELAKNKPNCRLMQYKQEQASSQLSEQNWETKSVEGGILVQTPAAQQNIELEVVTTIQPTENQLSDLRFAWQVIQSVKSNAIVLAKNLQSIGIGAGQSSRVFSIKIAQMRAAQAELSLQGAVLASDAFFPFQDNVELAHTLGISAIIQPGGSKRDPEIIQCANDLGICMVFTHIRQFSH